MYDELYDCKFAHNIELSFRLYHIVLQALFRLIADIVMIPGILIIALTTYRWKSTYYGYTSPLRHILGIQWHLGIAVSIVLIIHDVCILSPCLLVALVIGTYRTPKIIGLIKTLLAGEATAQRIQEYRLRYADFSHDAEDDSHVNRDRDAENGATAGVSTETPYSDQGGSMPSYEDPLALPTVSDNSSSGMPSAPLSEGEGNLLHKQYVVQDGSETDGEGWVTKQLKPLKSSKNMNTHRPSFDVPQASAPTAGSDGDVIVHADAVLISEVEASNVTVERIILEDDVQLSTEEIIKSRSWALDCNTSDDYCNNPYKPKVMVYRTLFNFDMEVRRKLWKSMGEYCSAHVCT